MTEQLEVGFTVTTHFQEKVDVAGENHRYAFQSKTELIKFLTGFFDEPNESK